MYVLNFITFFVPLAHQCVWLNVGVVVGFFLWCYCCWPVVSILFFFCSERASMCMWCLCSGHIVTYQLISCIVSFVCFFSLLLLFLLCCECEWKSKCVFSWALAKCTVKTREEIASQGAVEDRSNCDDWIFGLNSKHVSIHVHVIEIFCLAIN